MTATATTTSPETRAREAATAELPPRRQLTWRRLRTPAAGVAMVCLLLGALGQSAGTVIAGRLAENPSTAGVWWLALAMIGGAAVATVGWFVWSGVSDRAEGQLRQDLLYAALHQPLAVLSEQAVGEILDRVDDDSHEVGTLVRRQVFQTLQMVALVIPLWVISSITWWPAWFIFPLVGAATWWALRSLLPELARRKVVEEMAWTDHAAALEEGIAGRDDLRTSLGQRFAVRRVVGLSAVVHERFLQVVNLERSMLLRTGLLTGGLLSLVAVAGVLAADHGSLSLGALITLFMTTSLLVGQIAHLAQMLPDLQAGVGALMRLRQMLSAEPEPDGGAPVPDAPADLTFADLSFRYTEGDFALQDIDLTVPAGQTMALVGRTGSGKSTLASLISRAVEPPIGEVYLAGQDVRDTDLQDLRAAVGVVTQATEILAGTLAENITLFEHTPRDQVSAAVTELGLTEWVDSLPEGLDTVLGPGGTKLSAGEEQLVAFARLLVRDVRVVVLDEATARMDPLTEARVIAASDRLLVGRTGILVAHRLSTIARADLVTVLERGRVIQTGGYDELAQQPGAFADLLAAGQQQVDGLDAAADVAPAESADPVAVGAARRTVEPPQRPPVSDGSSLAAGITRALLVRPSWGFVAVVQFLIFGLFSALGPITGWVWGRTVVDLQDGSLTPWWTLALVAGLLLSPLVMADALRRYPRWWVEVLLRVRLNVMRGQIATHRLPAAPPGEVVARAMDADRYARYADRWVDLINSLIIAGITAVVAGTYWAGVVLLVVLVTSAAASVLGRPIAGRSAARAAAARAAFGRSLVSALESARTVKLAARTPQVHAHLHQVDSGRVGAAIREHRVQAVLDGVPIVMVNAGAVAVWAAFSQGFWGLATTLLVFNAVRGFDWFGQVAGAVVTEAPGTRAWQKATARFAGGAELMDLPRGLDLEQGSTSSVSTEAAPESVTDSDPLGQLVLRDLSVVHDDGTIGIENVDLTVRRGELVLLLGQIGSGKSSLLRSMAGLLDHTGSLRWNDAEVGDPEAFLRPGRVAMVGQVPRVFSGSFVDNVQLGFAERPFDQPVADARLAPDVADAGGPDAIVGHRGVRLSGGQVQRLALARALATESDLLLADDVSSALDAATEVELWQALRERSVTVVGATSKRAALIQADRVVVLDAGRVAASGPWQELESQYGHLAG
ncbi:ATP-binding cassette domain-containing protein [Dermacoccaceae bacterium W4C1]